MANVLNQSWQPLTLMHLQWMERIWVGLVLVVKDGADPTVHFLSNQTVLMKLITIMVFCA